MSAVGSFFAENWIFIVILLVLVVIIAIIHAVRKVLREGGGAFRLDTIKKNSDPNKEYIKIKAQAMLKDADMICEVSGNHVIPKREDLAIFRAAVKSRFKVAMFLIESENKVAYFFCKTEQGLHRRIDNLLPDNRSKNSHWPYADQATGEKLRFPRV
ncbi:MAG: hypothetical protein M0P13_11220 [Fibrobacteraceae bacterium]|nr:hypothetical protein [Fibrobacteraceae bacterium]